MFDRFNLWLVALAAHAQELKTREDGQALVEYALILSLVSIAAVVALKATGTSITGILDKINAEL
jgi:Flp pilus assembly pilin Flp